jgi:4-amino-4-deoxy-L-arabinose transferase-like glycosyltransferase
MPTLERAYWLLVSLLLAALGAIQITTMRMEVQTFDEGFHLAAGYSYLSQGDYRMNPEHPPLSKLLAAAMLLPMRPSLPTDSDAWHTRDQWEFADKFLYENRAGADEMLLAARLPTVALTLLLALAVAWWTRSRYGPAAGLLAAALTAFDPNLIAHGRYVTSDVIVTLFYFLAVVLWITWLETGRRAALLGASAAFGLAQVSKFSAVILVPVLSAIFLLRAWRTRTWSWRRVALGVASPAIAALLLIGAAYWRETGRLLTRKTSESSYLTGLRIVRDHNRMGHETYLLGEKRREGVWQYFPVAMAVKTPSATLLLAALLLLFALAKRPPAYFATIAIAIAAGGYFVWAMSSRINLGLRHLLPFYPLFYVLLAAGAVRLGRARLAAAAVALAAAESLAAYPHYLAFFNVLSGGPDRGANYLLDSNLDWGQDLKKLKRYAASQGDPPLCLEYFGTANLSYYGVRAMGVPRSDANEIAQVDCMLAISVTLLKGLYVDPGSYVWLHDKTPVAKVGWSIWVYDLRKR